MPAPVSEETTPVEMPTPVTPEVTPVEMPAPVAPEVTTVKMSAPVVEETTSTDAPVQESTPVENTNLAAPDLGVASMSNLDPVNVPVENGSAPSVDGPSATEIAAGIESGNLVNAVSDPNAMIGAKVGNTADDTDEINKKKGKKNLTVLIVILVILAILGIGGYFVYNYEYKSANKRIDTMVGKLNSFVLQLLIDVEKRMGDYEVQASATQGSEHKAEVHLTGNYAYNLEDYIYFDTKIDKIYVDEDLLDKTPIEANVYLNDDTLFLKVEELFPKYIKTEFDGLDDIMSSIKQNDIDYTLYYNAVINALKVSIKNYTVKQTIGKTSITGKSQQANIITISLNKSNYKAFVQSFTSILSSNSEFTSSLAKLTGESEEDIIKGIKESGETDYDFNGNLTINFYSPLFGSKLLGIEATVTNGEDTYKATFVPQGNDEWKVTAYEGNDKVTEFTYGFKSTQASGKKSYVTTFKGEYSYEDYEEKKQVIQLDVKFTYNINVQFQDDKPVTREAVDVENLTQEDIASIYNNLSTKYGLLGTYLGDYIEDLFGGSDSDDDGDDSYCAMAHSCSCEGTSCECKYYDDNGEEQEITCPNKVNSLY